jgi:hypothetical protein
VGDVLYFVIEICRYNEAYSRFGHRGCEFNRNQKSGFREKMQKDAFMLKVHCVQSTYILRDQNSVSTVYICETRLLHVTHIGPYDMILCASDRKRIFL